MSTIVENLEKIPNYPVLFASLILVGAFMLAWLIEFVLWRFLAAAAARTQNALDDKIIACLRRPIFYSILFYGVSWAVEHATLEWVDWYNKRRLFEKLGNMPPAEYEAAYHQRNTSSDMVSALN